MSFIAITQHAKIRAFQRFRLNEKVLLRLAEKSVTEGYSIVDAPSRKIAKYLQRTAKGKKIYVYGGYVFIFSDEFVLITTYRLPKYLLLSLQRKKTYIGK